MQENNQASRPESSFKRKAKKFMILILAEIVLAIIFFIATGLFK